MTSEFEKSSEGRLFDSIIVQSTWRSQYPTEVSINEEALKQIFAEARKEIPRLLYKDDGKRILVVMRFPHGDIVIGAISKERYKDVICVTEKIDNLNKWFGDEK